MLSLPRLEIGTLDYNILVRLESVSTIEVSPGLGISGDLMERYPFLRGHSAVRVAPSSRETVKGPAQTTRPYDLEIAVSAASEEASDGVQRIGLIEVESLGVVVVRAGDVFSAISDGQIVVFTVREITKTTVIVHVNTGQDILIR